MIYNFYEDIKLDSYKNLIGFQLKDAMCSHSCFCSIIVAVSQKRILIWSVMGSIQSATNFMIPAAQSWKKRKNNIENI